MDSSSAIGAVSAVLGATFRILEKGFEISAVGDQAKSLLKTVDQVSGQLKDASTLRRQKSSLFTKLEKRMIDDTIKYTEEAISLVATLVEPARADMEVTGGSIRFPTRLLFVLRDSPRIQVCLTQLGIASQSLNRDLTILCEREGRSMTPMLPEISVKPAPPPYDEVVFLRAQRLRNMQRRGSALSLPATLKDPAIDARPQFDLYVRSSSDITSTTEGFEHSLELDTESELDSAEDEGVRVPATPVSTHSSGLHPSDAFPSTHLSPRHGAGRQRSLRWLEAHTK